jgi:hypothetical protein
MVGLSIAAQSLVVFHQNKHRSAGEIAKEVLIVLSFFKPVIDLRRLMGGQEVDGAPIDTQGERNTRMVVETVCESVPASIIAMVALLLVGKWAWAPIVSIVISWITTAFKATSLSFSLDTNRRLRKLDPWFAPTTTISTTTHHPPPTTHHPPPPTTTTTTTLVVRQSSTCKACLCANAQKSHLRAGSTASSRRNRRGGASCTPASLS